MRQLYRCDLGTGHINQRVNVVSVLACRLRALVNDLPSSGQKSYVNCKGFKMKYAIVKISQTV